MRKEKKSKNKSLSRQRRSFSLQLKLSVLNHYDKTKNISNTAKLFNVHNDCIRNWIRQKDELKASHSKSLFNFIYFRF